VVVVEVVVVGGGGAVVVVGATVVVVCTASVVVVGAVVVVVVVVVDTALATGSLLLHAPAVKPATTIRSIARMRIRLPRRYRRAPSRCSPLPIVA
jgi:cobalamin biosynthesis protein CobD/CbiB